MRIEYENKFMDILIFNSFHQILSPVLQIFFLIAVTFIMFIDLRYPDSSLREAIILGLKVYVIMWVVQLLFNVIYLYSKKDKAILTKHVLEIQDESLYEETKYNRSFFYWNGIVKIIRRPGFLAIYVTKHMAHVIPARAFISAEQRNDFYQTISAKLE